MTEDSQAAWEGKQVDEQGINVNSQYQLEDQDVVAVLRKYTTEANTGILDKTTREGITLVAKQNNVDGTLVINQTTENIGSREFTILNQDGSEANYDSEWLNGYTVAGVSPLGREELEAVMLVLRKNQSDLIGSTLGNEDLKDTTITGVGTLEAVDQYKLVALTFSNDGDSLQYSAAGSARRYHRGGMHVYETCM